MKSAYEIAMARLEKESGPTKKLTDEQKAEVAEIDKVYDAKVAEKRLAYDAKLGAAESLDELNALKAQLAEEITALEAERDKAKAAIWDAA